jgi:pimeloyl-ACP methyl ester carboxylesterase
VDPKGLSIDGGTTVFRIQYTSLDYDGAVVPVTGFIAFPYAPHYGSARHRLVAFAHGTIGLFPGCAPSNGPALYDYSTWQPVLQRGYAIVATDYAGLGNNYTTHKYLSFPAHANDIYYSVVTARRLFPATFTPEWMSFGHSQGGGAVWKLAESAHLANDTSYLGTVAIAPSSYFIRQLADGLSQEEQTPGAEKGTGLAFLPFIPMAAQRVIPSYRESILSATLRNRTRLAVEAQLCLNGMLGMSMDLSAGELFSPAGADKDMPLLLGWEEMVAPAQGELSPAPVFIVQGLDDSAVSWKTTRQAWNTSCQAGNEVHLRLYPLQGHRPSLTAGAPEWTSWMDRRFEKRDLKMRRGVGACTKVVRMPFNVDYVRAPTDLDLKPFLK